VSLGDRSALEWSAKNQLPIGLNNSELFVFIILVMTCFALVAFACITKTFEHTKLHKTTFDFSSTVFYSMVSSA